MLSMINTVMEPENLVMILSAVAAFATILTLTLPLLQTDRLATRMKYVSTERELLRQRSREELARERSRLRSSPKGFIKQIVDQLNLG